MDATMIELQHVDEHIELLFDKLGRLKLYSVLDPALQPRVRELEAEINQFKFDRKLILRDDGPFMNIKHCELPI